MDYDNFRDRQDREQEKRLAIVETHIENIYNTLEEIKNDIKNIKEGVNGKMDSRFVENTEKILNAYLSKTKRQDDVVMEKWKVI